LIYGRRWGLQWAAFDYLDDPVGFIAGRVPAGPAGVKLGDQADFRARGSQTDETAALSSWCRSAALPLAEIAGGSARRRAPHGAGGHPDQAAYRRLRGSDRHHLARGRTFDLRLLRIVHAPAGSAGPVVVELVLGAGAALVAVFGPGFARRSGPGPLRPDPGPSRRATSRPAASPFSSCERHARRPGWPQHLRVQVTAVRSAESTDNLREITDAQLDGRSPSLLCSAVLGSPFHAGRTAAGQPTACRQ